MRAQFIPAETISSVRTGALKLPARSKPLRVAFLVRSLGCGGAQRQLVLLARGLHGLGHEIAVVEFYGGGYFEGELAAAGVPVYALGKEGRWDLAGFYPRLVRLLRRLDPEIVHGYLSTPNILAASLRAALPGTKIVLGVRDARLGFSGQSRMTRLVQAAESHLSRLADLVIANSEAGLGSGQTERFHARRAAVIPNGIDTDCFRPDAEAGRRWRELWRIGEGEPLIGLVARVDPRKDHETFVRAAALALQLRTDLRFVCVGDGTVEYGDRLRRSGFESSFFDRLIFAGRSDKPAEVYNALDVATLSSVTEGFPNVIGEAMACGVPCVATDVGEAGRVVGRTGVVVPSLNPEALAAGWLQCLGAKRAGGGAAARQRVVENFSASRLVASTEAALQALSHRADI